MKKIIIILCITSISVTAMAQSGVRIGNMEFVYRKVGNDTITQITVDDPCPPCPSEKETRPKATYKSRVTDGFCGLGFILPDNGNDFYTVRGGNSFSIDVGGERRYHLSRNFALGGLTQYSFYNYRLRPVEPTYLHEVIGNIDPNHIKKQVFRSHNFAAGVFARLYLSAPKSSGKGGMFIEGGAQSDFAFSKYCKLKLNNPKGKGKYRDGYTFNPFTASATARIGWGSTVVFARYRFTDAFNKKELTTPMDLPRVTIGLQFH